MVSIDLHKDRGLEAKFRSQKSPNSLTVGECSAIGVYQALEEFSGQGNGAMIGCKLFSEQLGESPLSAFKAY